MSYKHSLHEVTKMLKNINTFLDKGVHNAEARKFDATVLLNARLAPDQFPLVRQIQIACDNAKYGFARLANKEKEAPAHADTEQTVAEIKERINSVVSYLSTFNDKDFAGAEERKITMKWWEGKYLNGEDYLNEYLLPNFYFHVTTAYAILRHNGVDVGKRDFLGELPFK